MNNLTPRLSGEPMLWILLFGDIALYSLFLVFFGIDYNAQNLVFRESQESLTPAFGFINTIVLLTGSWFVVRGLQVLREKGNDYAARRKAAGYVLYAVVCGAVFTILKVTEYMFKVKSGVSMTDNAFFVYYFALTGLHLIHVLIGIVTLYYMRRHIERAITIDYQFLESSANFWHLVDLLWIMLFPLIYLV